MTITEDILRMLGCKQEGDKWVLLMHGITFTFIPDGSHWDFEGHAVSDLEECFAFAYKEGIYAGKKEKQDEIRSALFNEE